MICSKLKILIYVAIGLMLLFTPFLLDVSPDGKAHAMGILSGSGGGGGSSDSQIVVADPESAPPVHHTPEPATLLLVGGGAIGLAALRKKFMKK
jgi:hypothetical protein